MLVTMRIFVAIIGLLISALLSIPASAQNNDGENAAPITITYVAALDFGTISGDATLPGLVTINSSTGTKTVSGGAYDFGGIHTRANFSVGGTPNAPFTIILPASIVLTSGVNTMQLAGFTSSPSTIGLIGPVGSATLYVGGTLQVGTNQASGTYSGFFDVTVNY